MDVLDNIRCLLSERGWSVYKLSEQSGVAQSTLSNMFNRCNLPSVTTLEAICKGFGITLSEFFSNEEEMIALDAERKQLLKRFDRLSAKQKEVVLELLERMGPG